MRSLPLILLTASAVSAFPSMGTREQMARRFLKERAPADPVTDLLNTATNHDANSITEFLGDTVGGLAGTLQGLLGSVAQGVLNPENKRPEPGYDFHPPGPGDSRGPCPGLNLLANHGYLPRNGTVTFGQVVEATARGFNMGTDLSTVLCTFAVLGNGDLATESFNLGTGPGGIGGLNRHSTVEADISPGREDFYNGCGDNHHLSSRIVKQNVEVVAKSESKLFDLDNMGDHFALTAAFSRENNPYLFYFPFPSIVSFAAFAFYPNFFGNGTYGFGGVPNYESISSIIGAEYDPEEDAFKYVPERWPENWYRRAFPYTTLQALTEGLAAIYAKYPVPMPVSQLGTDNLNAQTFLCNLYQGLIQATPLGIAGTAQEIEAKVTWAISKLDPFFKDTVLGCPSTSFSNSFLYPDEPGSTLQPPPSVLKNTGDNVYNKIYFKEAPVTPNCDPASKA